MTKYKLDNNNQKTMNGEKCLARSGELACESSDGCSNRGVDKPGDGQPLNLYGLKMSEEDFRHFSEFIHEQCGIKMPKEKKLLLESRLQRRLRALGMDSFTRYRDFVFSPEGTRQEIFHMIDAITTNKTDFFREPEHFEFLVNVLLPQLYAVDRFSRLTIWSAGCSTGEEPYTLAMVLSEFASSHPGFSFSIIASDISVQVLEKAASGVYTMDKIDPIPIVMTKKYLLRHRDKEMNIFKIAPELRSTISFRRVNLMEEFTLEKPMDIIFCRNVMIYFDRDTQEKLLNRFYRSLAPDGFLFLGHSETLHGLRVPYVHVKPTVYRK